MSTSNGVYENDGYFNIAAGQTLTISGQNQVFNQDNGALQLDGALNLFGVTLNYNGGTIGGASGVPTLVGSQLNLGAQATNPAQFWLTGSASSMTGDIKPGQTVWVGGSASGSFTTFVVTNGFVNAGTLRLESADAGYDTLFYVNNGVLTNGPTGIINVNAGTGGSRAFGANLLNEGVFNANVNVSVGQTNTALLNQGVISVANGQVLSILGSFTQTAGATILNGGVLSPASPVFVQGGTVSGSGTFSQSVTNAGTFSPGNEIGALTVAGDYIQSGAGALNVTIGGAAAQSQYSQLLVSGAALVAGQLRVTLANNFIPTNGSTFVALNATQVSGTFTNFYLALLPAGQIWQVLYSGSQVVLKVAGAGAGNTLTLSGTVSNNQGKGIAGATISAYNPAGDGSVFEAITDSSGHYQIAISDGTWQVAATGLAGLGYRDTANRTVTMNGANAVVNFTVTPSSGQNYSLSVQSAPAGAGVVTGGGSFPGQSMVTVTAAPTTNEPWQFVNWTFNGIPVSTNAVYSFTLVSDTALIANFALPTYQVAVSNNPAGAGLISGTGTFIWGTADTLTATPEFGYVFNGWSDQNGNSLGATPYLQLTVTSNTLLTANYAGTNFTHVVSTATVPAGVASLTGSGSYTNGQTASFAAPSPVTNGPVYYAFSQFQVNGVFFTNQPAFTWVFSTVDPSNFDVTAIYSTHSVLPEVIDVSANFSSPVLATSNLVLSFQFDRSMQPSVTPTVLVTNTGKVQPTVAAGGAWSATVFANDTYTTPGIALVQGMDGTNLVFISEAQDLNGQVLPLTNVLSLLVDATPPQITSITAIPAATTALIDWNTDKAATSQVEYGPTIAYGSATPMDGQFVTLHSVGLSGLSILSPYHFRVHSVDVAGNASVSGDRTFSTIALPDLQVTNLQVSVALSSGMPLTVAWTDTNSGGGPTFSLWFDEVSVSNVTTGRQLLAAEVLYDPSTEGNLARHGSSNRQVSFVLPDGTEGAGSLSVSVQANVYNNQMEADTNNNSASTLVVSSLSAYPDLQVANLGLAQGTVESGATVTLNWNDANTGQGPVTGDFQDQIIVSNASRSTLIVNTLIPYDPGVTGPIAPGTSAARQFSFTLPSGAAGVGALQIQVTVNAQSNIFEYNAGGSAQNNNTSAITANSMLAPYPDLTVSNITIPANASPGQKVAVSWTEYNIGSGPATNTWTDRIFLSSDGAIDSLQLIGEFLFTNGLAAGQSAIVTQLVTLPPFASGRQWPVVTANAAGDVIELNPSNNTAIANQPVNLAPALSLTLNPGTVRESAGAKAVIATLSRNGATTSALAVELATATGTNVSLPPKVVIPAGQNSVTFPLSILDNAIAGGEVTENVSATAAGFAPAVAPLTILESDAAVLSLTLSTNAVPEDAPAGAVIGTVSRNANFGQPLTVTLISDTPSALTVPASVIIPAGQASATFGLTPVNDGLVGDTRRANVSASAPGFSAESVFVYVLNVNTVQLTLRLANSAVTKGAASPATIGTITCKPPPPTSQDISLTVVGSSLVTVPPVVTIPAGASSVAFNVNVGDDGLVTGPQIATLQAQVVLPDLVVLTNGQASAPLTVLDTHGPTLSLSLAATSIAKGSNTTVTVTRNTPPTNALTVDLSLSPTNIVTVPVTVVIASNQASATFPLNAILDSTQTGPEEVTLTASAAGFNDAVASLGVSDIYVPDLAPVAILAAASAMTSQQITVSWVVTNSGLGAASGSWGDTVYLASDGLGDGQQAVASVTNPMPLAVGASYTNHATFGAPQVPGNYWVVIATDSGNAVSEINKDNNTFTATAPIVIDAAYRAAISTAVPSLAGSGTPIVFTGKTFNSANSAPAPNSAATIRVLVNGTRRVFDVTSDANGNFSYTFQPLGNEVGDYTAGADYPLIAQDPSQVSFILLGMQAQPPSVTGEFGFFRKVGVWDEDFVA